MIYVKEFKSIWKRRKNEDIIWTNLIEVHLEMLHTKYQSSKPSSFREREFWSFSSLFLNSNLWPMGREQFWLQGHYMNKLGRGTRRCYTPNIKALCHLVSEEKIFKDFTFLFSFWLPWQPELLMELNSLNKFCGTSPIEHPCQVSSRLAHWFRRRRY